LQKLWPYLSFKGRTNRQAYWVTSVLVYLGFLAVSLATMGIPFLLLAFGLPALIVGLWVGLAVAVRRLHDRNRSGWWLLAMYLPIALLSFLRGAASVSSPDAGAFFGLLTLPFSIWAFVWLACLKGTTGPNRFGDDPLNPTPAEVFS